MYELQDDCSGCGLLTGMRFDSSLVTNKLNNNMKDIQETLVISAVVIALISGVLTGAKLQQWETKERVELIRSFDLGGEANYVLDLITNK
tara:strand:- start:238 stop:507 length:270 start_codon:yes stop_codon:yes gene_type:complete